MQGVLLFVATCLTAHAAIQFDKNAPEGHVYSLQESAALFPQLQYTESQSNEEEHKSWITKMAFRLNPKIVQMPNALTFENDASKKIIFPRRDANGAYITIYEMTQSEPNTYMMVLMLESEAHIRLYSEIDGRVARLKWGTSAISLKVSTSPPLHVLYVAPIDLKLRKTIPPGGKILVYIPSGTTFVAARKSMVASPLVRQAIDETWSANQAFEVPIFDQDGVWPEDTVKELRKFNVLPEGIVSEHISQFLTGQSMPTPSDPVVLTMQQTALRLPKLVYQPNDDTMMSAAASKETSVRFTFHSDNNGLASNLPLDTYLTVYETPKRRQRKQAQDEYVSFKYKSDRRCPLELYSKRPGDDKARLRRSVESSDSTLHFFTLQYDRGFPEGTKIYLYAPERCGKVSLTSVKREFDKPSRALLELLKEDPSVQMPVCSLPAELWRFVQ